MLTKLSQEPRSPESVGSEASQGSQLRMPKDAPLITWASLVAQGLETPRNNSSPASGPSNTRREVQDGIDLLSRFETLPEELICEIAGDFGNEDLVRFCTGVCESLWRKTRYIYVRTTF